MDFWKILLVGIVFVFAVLFLAKATNLFAISGTQDSDLLSQKQALSDGTLISASPIYMLGQNQPLVGDVVLMNFAVGTGNDVAAIGTVDSENMNATGEGKTVNYKVYVKKNSMNTFISLSGTKKVLRNTSVADEGTYSSFSLGTVLGGITEKQNAILSAGQAALTNCKNTEGSNFAGLAWRPATYSEATSGINTVDCSDGVCARCNGIAAFGVCGGGWNVIAYAKCYHFGSTSFEYQDFGAKTINASFDVQVESQTNGASQTVTLSTNNSTTAPEAYIVAGGQTIGYAKINYFGQAAELPIDLTTEVPVTGSGTSYSWRIGDKTYASQAWSNLNDLQSFGVGTAWNGNWSTVEGKINSYNTNYDQFRSNLATKFSEKYSFSFSNNGFLINDAFTRMANLQVIVKGNWIGLIRDVADFDLTCGNSVSGYEQETKNSTVLVKNISSTSGAGSLSWGCPTSNGTRSISLGAGQSTTIDVSFSSPNATTGDCSFLLAYGTKQKTCIIHYNFMQKAPTCGNGINEPNLGENCVSCPQDVICGLGKNCNQTTGSCEYPPPTCGDAKQDTGENCANCPQDVKCPQETTCQPNGTCQQAPDGGFPLWIIAIALLIVAIILGYYLVVKK